jgi:ubiquinone/menaquinone biosynthesis C-methylase UbiE
MLYCDPLDHGPLDRQSDGLRNPRTNVLYPFRDGIPVFVTPSAIDGPNGRYQRLYDRVAPFYDVSTRLYAWLKSGAEQIRRGVYLKLLELPPSARFLEVSVGTGANWSYLRGDLQFHGLDLSWGMLTRCRRRVRRLHLEAELCQGLAEHLPYPENSFDCVFHMGGINFFTDPAAALREMVRVARPGTRLVVVDETEEFAQRHEKGFAAKAFYGKRPRTIKPPSDLLPPGMEEVRLDTVWAGDLYVLSFRKPGKTVYGVL